MKLSVKAMGLTLGLLWGGMVLVVGLAHLIWPQYGVAFLGLVSSIYPGYDVGGFGSVIVGTLYGLIDGWVGGIILAWLYNKLVPTAAAG